MIWKSKSKTVIFAASKNGTSSLHDGGAAEGMLGESREREIRKGHLTLDKNSHRKAQKNFEKKAKKM